MNILITRKSSDQIRLFEPHRISKHLVFIIKLLNLIGLYILFNSDLTEYHQRLLPTVPNTHFDRPLVDLKRAADLKYGDIGYVI